MVLDTFTRGHELVMVLMDNASSPEMLYQLVATCSVGKDMFEEWPVRSLKRAIMGMPEDLRQLAIAFTASIHQVSDQWQTMIPFAKPLAEVQVECDSWGFEKASESVVNCFEHQSPYVFIIEQYLNDRPSAIPDRLKKPLQVLKSLSTVYEAIEILSDADIWQSVQQIHCERSSAAEKHSFRRALWRYQIFCSLYWKWKDSPSSADFARMSATDAPFTRHQRRFLHQIGAEGTRELVIIYDDFLTLLQQIYASDLASLFEEHLVDSMEFWGNNS